MDENPIGVLVGSLAAGLALLIAFIVFAKFFSVSHEICPTPMDNQIWRSFVISWSLISAADTLLFISAIIAIITGLAILLLKGAGNSGAI